MVALTKFFLSVEQIQRYLANLQINNFIDQNVQLKWMEIGVEKHLRIPSQTNLTQSIIMNSVAKPEPLLFTAFDESGRKVQINLKNNISIQLQQFGTDITLNLTPRK